MEDLAEKDATEKSDAAREAFLAELALDSKKIVKGGSENTRQVEKTKDKKKNKDHRKTRDLKVILHVEFVHILCHCLLQLLKFSISCRLQVVMCSTCFKLQLLSKYIFLYYSGFSFFLLYNLLGTLKTLNKNVLDVLLLQFQPGCA